MALVNAGRNIITQMIAGEAVDAYDNSNAYLGVGDSNTAVAVDQTDLQAASNKDRQEQESGYPSRSTNVLTYKSKFESGDGNFSWEEWGLFNASSGGTMLCRKVSDLGTKSSGATWYLEVEITVSIGS